MSTNDAPLLPCLKEFKWPGHTDTVCHALWDREPSPYMPWVAFGYDHPHTFEFINTKQLTELNTTAQDLEAKALAALCARPAKWEPVDVDANGKKLRILTCEGDFFSAERILDAAFMHEAQRILKATGLSVGVPRRGLLMATTANQDKELIAGFGGAVAGQFSRGESARGRPSAGRRHRKHIPKLLEHLKGICNEMSRGNERRYRVSLTYQKGQAACVESDRELDHGVTGACIRKSGCLADLCERQFAQERDGMDRVLTSFLKP